MKKITIPLYGISRNTDDTISTDGDCTELINARVKNGSIVPIGQPIVEKTFLGKKAFVYLHKNGLYEHLISYDGSTLVYDSDREQGVYTNKNTLICAIEKLNEIQSIGNTLSLITSESIHYALFVNGSYQYLGEKPEFQKINIEYFMDTQVEKTDDIWCDLDPRIKMRNGESVALNDNSVSLVNSSFQGTASKFLKELNDKGKFVYPFIIRYAMRMFDGSYIMHSPPILLKPKGTSASILVVDQSNKDGHVTDFKYRISVQASELIIKYDLSTLAKWKDIISSVDVFISNQIVTDDINKNITSLFCTGEHIYFDFNKLKESEVLEKIENTSLFYKIKSIPTGSTTGSLSENLIKEASKMNNLEQKELLTDDGFTHNTITGKTYAFNGRLHVANIKTKFAPMYPLSIFQESSYAANTLANTEVHIKTDSGIKIIHGISFWNTQELSPYISYPDSRAFKLVIYFVYSGSSYYKEIELKPHPLLNTAYNIRSLKSYTIEDFTRGSYFPKEENNTEITPNKIKVSSVSNPFFFPAKQTYTISNRGVIGMAVATIALSTGQFGQFPLYVFTEEGIYALSTGTGDVAYLNSYPVSRDCCTNPSSITSTDNAVLFSSSNGLMLLSGSSVTKLSGKIEGYLPSCIDSSPVIKKIANITGYKNILSSTEFVYYLKEAKIGYNYEDKEIIVANPSYSYSYVYNIESGEWNKATTSIQYFVNSYPECFAMLANNSMCNMHNSHRAVNKILLLTRPIKFGSLTHKRILQSALRGIIKPSLSDVYFRGEPVQFREENVQIFSEAGFYILGSNDAEHFSLLAGTEKLNDIRDLITKMNKTKAYKYFMFCLVGGVRTDVAINYIEVMADEAFDNRLR